MPGSRPRTKGAKKKRLKVRAAKRVKAQKRRGAAVPGAM